jgi:hypothetical protein
MVNGPAGWPEYEYRGTCRQVVGIRSFWDVLNVQRSYCALPGHKADVDEQARLAELAERVRHDTEREARPVCNDRAELLSVRPELRRYL